MKIPLPLIAAFLVTASVFAQPSIQSSPPPESSAKDLTTLIGKWYCSGDINKPCYVTSSGDSYFAINEAKLAFSISPTEGTSIIFKGSGDSFPVIVLAQHLLGYNWWWSRTPNVSAETASPK